MRIAISGKQGVGKNLLSEFIIKNYKYKDKHFTSLAFADNLKFMVKEIFDVEKDLHPNSREILQLFGKIGRLSNPLYWINPILEDINDFPKDNYIITDLRFKNEADELKNNNFFIIRINASDDIRKERREIRNEDDISETDLDNYDFDYYFNGDLDKDTENYKIEVKKMLGHLIKLQNELDLEEIKNDTDK